MKSLGLILSTVLTIGGLLTPAHAERVTGTYIACISEDLLDEAVGYIVKQDQQGLMQLIVAGQCTLLQRGEQVSVISPGFVTATVRYKGIKLYTPSEAVR